MALESAKKWPFPQLQSWKSHFSCGSRRKNYMGHRFGPWRIFSTYFWCELWSDPDLRFSTTRGKIENLGRITTHPKNRWKRFAMAQNYVAFFGEISLKNAIFRALFLWERPFLALSNAIHQLFFSQEALLVKILNLISGMRNNLALLGGGQFVASERLPLASFTLVFVFFFVYEFLDRKNALVV